MALLYHGLRQIATLKGVPGPRRGRAMREIGLVQDAAILVEDGRILAIGPEARVRRHPKVRRAKKKALKGVAFPGFVDSHTHPVFAAPRLLDFSLRSKGFSYVEIGRRGGGIRSSIRAVRAASEAELASRVAAQAKRFLACGTTLIEAKTGYGLDLDSELKGLRALRRAAKRTPLEIVPTFLGAHAVPPGWAGAAAYAEHVIRDMLPQVAAAGLAEYADVFCEKGFFPKDVSRKVLAAAAALGLRPRIHAEQLSASGGALVAGAVRAVSADHLDHVTPAGIRALKKAGTIASLVPASNQYLGMPLPDARRLLDAGVPVALATDFNPGSAPCWNMQFVLHLAVVGMKMSPEEALTAATVNGAAALERAATHGRLVPGARADFAVFDAADWREPMYYFGADVCTTTVKNGKVVDRR